MAVALKRIALTEPDACALQEQTLDTLRGLVTHPLLGGRIDTFRVMIDPQQFAHKLGRKPVGWIVVRRDNDGVIWEIIGEANESTLTLTSTTTVNATIYIF